jgi:hypothetical protein
LKTAFLLFTMTVLLCASKATLAQSPTGPKADAPDDPSSVLPHAAALKEISR